MSNMRYDREALVTVLVAHQRASVSHCLCGWNELGRSHPEHVASAYEEVAPASSPLAAGGETQYAMCSFNHGEQALARIYLSDGCLGRPDDRYQDVCIHHLVSCSPHGSMTVIGSYALNATVEDIRRFSRERVWPAPVPAAGALEAAALAWKVLVEKDRRDGALTAWDSGSWQAGYIAAAAEASTRIAALEAQVESLAFRLELASQASDGAQSRYLAASDGKRAAEVRNAALEALTRLRDNPYWTCHCASRAEGSDLSDEVGVESWQEGAVWPDPLTHDMRCPVNIAAEALAATAAEETKDG